MTIRSWLTICCLALLLPIQALAAGGKPRARRAPLKKPVPGQVLSTRTDTSEAASAEETVESSQVSERRPGAWRGGVKLSVLLPTFSDDLGWRNEGHGTLFEVGDESVATHAGFVTELYGEYRWIDYFSTGLFLSVQGYDTDEIYENDYNLSLALGIRLKGVVPVTDTVEIRAVASAAWGLGILGGIGAAPTMPVEVENRANGQLILQGALEGVYYFSGRMGLVFDVGILAVPYAFQNVMVRSGDQALDLFRVESTFGPVLYASAGIEFKI